MADNNTENKNVQVTVEQGNPAENQQQTAMPSANQVPFPITLNLTVNINGVTQDKANSQNQVNDQKVVDIQTTKKEETPELEICLEPKVRRKRFPTIVETEKFILRTVKGQDEQVRSVVTAAYRSIKFDNIKSNVLIIGKSGTGKTEIMRQLAKKLNRVFITVDANEFTQEGYVGRDVSEIIEELITEAEGDVEAAQRGIVFIDEIDKKAGSVGIERDVSGRGVLNSLLKLIEGKVMKIPDPEDDWGQQLIDFDTKHLIIFLAGAFEGIEKIKNERLDTKKIGFSASKPDAQTEKVTTKYTKQDLIDYGLPEEFVGRIDTIVQMNELSEDVLVEILETSRGSVLKAYKDALKNTYGVSLKYNKDILRDIAKKASSKKTGARELSNVVNYMFEKILYDVMAAKKGRYKTCTLLKGIEADNTKYILK